MGVVGLAGVPLKNTGFRKERPLVLVEKCLWLKRATYLTKEGSLTGEMCSGWPNGRFGS